MAEFNTKRQKSTPNACVSTRINYNRANENIRCKRRLGPSLMNQSPLAICVIGTGRAGMIHARNFAFGRVDDAALVAIADPVEKARQAAARNSTRSRLCRLSRGAGRPAGRRGVVATPSEHHARSWSRRRGRQAHPLREADGHERRGVRRDAGGGRESGSDAADRLHAPLRRGLRRRQTADRRPARSAGSCSSSRSPTGHRSPTLDVRPPPEQRSPRRK